MKFNSFLALFRQARFVQVTLPETSTLLQPHAEFETCVHLATPNAGSASPLYVIRLRDMNKAVIEDGKLKVTMLVPIEADPDNETDQPVSFLTSGRESYYYEMPAVIELLRLAPIPIDKA